MLYRVFPMAVGAGALDEGGPMHVPRIYQGGGRHDNPDAYGALYATREMAAAIAERLRPFAVERITDAHLLSLQGRRYALAAIDDSGLDQLPDLDDPRQLLDRDLRPSRVATRDREATQPIALAIFEEGHDGLAWWSTIEASWINVTLFAERAAPKLTLAADPEPLTLDHAAVHGAAEALGVRLEG